MSDYGDDTGDHFWQSGPMPGAATDVTDPPADGRGPTWRNPRLWLIVGAPVVALLVLAGALLIPSSGQHPAPATHQPVPRVPAGTTLFGNSVATPADVTRWQATTGAPLPIVRVFLTGTFPATWSDDPVLSVLPATTAVVLSFKSGAAGALTAFLNSRPSGQRVYVSYYHEPEDQIAKGTFTAAAYRAAWQTYGAAIRAAGGIPTLILQQFTTSEASGRNWHDYYPGNAVDVIAWDGYNPARKGKHPGYTSYETKVIPRFEAIAAETGKPWGLAEFGSPIVGSDAQRVAWVKAVRQSLTRHGALWALWWDGKNPGFDDTATSPVRAAWRAP